MIILQVAITTAIIASALWALFAVCVWDKKTGWKEAWTGSAKILGLFIGFIGMLLGIVAFLHWLWSL